MPNRFDHIITEARRWVGDWDFVDIEGIAWLRENGAAGLWYPPWKEQTRAKITLGWDQNEDALWHEVFHSVAYHAPLIKLNPHWGEGWCCAFSEVMRRRFVRFPVGQRDPETHLEQLYNWPCNILVDYVQRDAAALRRFWLDWNHAPGDLSRAMAYDPKTGKRILTD